MSSGKRYDVFLSYHPADLKAVEYVAQRLLVMGISLFFDVWHLIPGSPWRESIEEALDGSQGVVLFLGPGGGAWEDKQMNAMIRQRVKAKSLSPILVLLPGARKPKSGEWVVFRQSLDEPEAIERLVSRIRAVAPVRDSEVQSNSNNHAPEKEVEMFPAETKKLIEKLKTTRFLAVLGPSGSDKSSIVRDGLLPALQKGALPDSQNWPKPIIFTPTARPLQELAKRLADLASGNTSHLGTLVQQLEAGERTLHLSVRLALRNAPRTHRLLLVVNQFEEVFTLCQDAPIRKQFLANLLYASDVKGGRVIVILIMQDELVPKCAEERVSASHISMRLMEAIKFKEVFEIVGKFQPVDPNPYVVGLPIDPDAGTPFVGRQDLIDWIETTLQSAQKPILVLYGQRRTGKTSVLRQLEKGPQGKHLRQGLGRPIYPVYIDLQGLTGLGTELFLVRIAEKILHTVRDHDLVCSDLAEQQFSREPYVAFNQFLDEVESSIDNGLLLLMLDEFEELEKGENKKIFSYFRSQMQDRDSIAFLLAGGNRLEEIYRNDLSMNFNNVLHREVTFLEPSEAQKLIRDPVCRIITYDKEGVDKILQTTQGHPYFIQFLCREIIEEMNKRAESNHISLADVNEATNRIIEQDDQQLNYLWDGFDSIDQAVLLTMAKLLHSKHSCATFDQIVEHLSRAGASLSEPDISKALNKLVARRMIKKSDSKLATKASYSYSFDLLRQWVSYKYPLNSVSLKEG